MTNRVRLIETPSPHARPFVEEHLSGSKIGLVFIDADGLVGQHLSMLNGWMHDDCVVILDDYDEPLEGKLMRPS